MGRLLSIEIQCQECDEVHGVIIDYEERNDARPSPCCEGKFAKRIWSVPNVSTAKTSASMPDGVTGGRFDELKVLQERRKEVSAAKKAYVANPNDANAKEIKKARNENAKAKRSTKK